MSTGLNKKFLKSKKIPPFEKPHRAEPYINKALEIRLFLFQQILRELNVFNKLLCKSVDCLVMIDCDGGGYFIHILKKFLKSFFSRLQY